MKIIEQHTVRHRSYIECYDCRFSIMIPAYSHVTHALIRTRDRITYFPRSMQERKGSLITHTKKNKNYPLETLCLKMSFYIFSRKFSGDFDLAFKELS